MSYKNFLLWEYASAISAESTRVKKFVVSVPRPLAPRAHGSPGVHRFRGRTTIEGADMSQSKSKKKGKTKKARRWLKDGLLAKGFSRGTKVLVNPAGYEKMSEVLGRFVDPYAQYADSEEDYKRLYSVAVIAWNAALLPPTGRSMIQKAIQATVSSGGNDAELIINELIQRKERYFDEYTRMILHYEIEMEGDGVRVSVASTLV